MKNKILVRVISPHLNNYYDVFIPINEYVGVVIELIKKILKDISDAELIDDRMYSLMNKDTGFIYSCSSIVRDTDIKNSTELILL